MARNRKNQGHGLAVSTVVKTVLICGTIVVCCVGYVWEKKQITELSQQIRNEEHRRDALRNNNEKLRRQLAELMTPLALEARVKELRLGLALPQPNQIWRLPEPVGQTAEAALATRGLTNRTQVYAVGRKNPAADEH